MFDGGMLMEDGGDRGDGDGGVVMEVWWWRCGDVGMLGVVDGGMLMKTEAFNWEKYV